MEAAAAAEFGITPRRVAQGNWWHTYLPAPYHCTHGRGNPLHAWFRELGIEDLRSHEKRLPAAMYAADDAEVCLFLRHLWATDGCVWLGNGASRRTRRTTPPRAANSPTASRTCWPAWGSSRASGRSRRPATSPATTSSWPTARACGPSASASASTADAAKRPEALATALAGRTVNTNVDTIPVERLGRGQGGAHPGRADRTAIPGGDRHPLLRDRALQEPARHESA